MEDQSALKGVVNKSGFPLQIGLSHLINAGTNSHGWRIQYSEHAWKNDVDDSSGFIDLVVENNARNMALVVECKRVQDTSWVFLNPQTQIAQRRYAKAWLSRYEDGKITEFDWVSQPLDPASVQTEFFCVFGQDSKSIPILERVGAMLVSSTEALTLEEKLTLLSKYFPCRIYLNVIVTTAKLKVCSFEPSDISLTDGTVSACTFTDIPFVRFQKQFSTRFPKSLSFSVGVSSEIAKAKENTVFVVNADHFIKFINELNQ